MKRPFVKLTIVALVTVAIVAGMLIYTSGRPDGQTRQQYYRSLVATPK